MGNADNEGDAANLEKQIGAKRQRMSGAMKKQPGNEGVQQKMSTCEAGVKGVRKE